MKHDFTAHDNKNLSQYILNFVRETEDVNILADSKKIVIQLSNNSTIY